MPGVSTTNAPRTLPWGALPRYHFAVTRKLVLSSLAIVGAAAVGGGLAWGVYEVLPPGRPLPGVMVDGRLVPRGSGLGDFLEGRRQALLSRSAYLDLPDGDGNIETTFGALGIEVDVAKTMEAVIAHAQSGDLGARLYRAKQAREGKVDLPLVWSFDPVRARATLEKLRAEVKRAPIDAKLDLRGHRRIDDVPGRELDVDGTIELIRDAEREEHAMIPLWTRPVAAQVTSAALAAVDVSKVVGAFETEFGNKPRSRDVNIAKAAEYLNGVVIGPGQTVSFNEIVGPRRIDRGFTWAPVIIDDELEPGVGGGVCQVATALHGAAVFSGLEVPARRSHSRPSGYAPLGLDATVIYGEVDLKIKNPYDSPLIIHAFLPKKHTLRVELLGRDPPGKVDHTYAVIRTHEFYRRVWTKPHLPAGKTLKRQRGIKGYDVVSTVRIQKPDGGVDERRYYSGYRPVPEVYWVAPGVAMSELPELPEGAGHVEVDGEKPGDAAAAIVNPYADPAPLGRGAEPADGELRGG